MITLLDTYKYRDGSEARILCLDRPSRDRTVVSMTDEGTTMSHYADGALHRCRISDRDLVKVSKWGHLKPDEPCVVRDKFGGSIRHRHFAKLDEEGRPLFFLSGCTSWSTLEGHTFRYNTVVVDGEDVLT